MYAIYLKGKIIEASQNFSFVKITFLRFLQIFSKVGFIHQVFQVVPTALVPTGYALFVFDSTPGSRKGK
jgi:hypothetical protein